MDISTAISDVIEAHDLSRKDMRTVMHTIMQGQATPAQIGGFLVALRIKGETVDEITAATEVMRELADKIEVDKTSLVDTCGTGGDGADTFNISTTAAFVVAASGARVAKHGNRAVSSQSGSADVLEAAGVNIDLNPDQVADCIDQVGIGFMFAPLHHGAMKYAIGPRRELRIRTLFNLLGPLSNPAGALRQLVGVYSRMWLEPMAETLRELGSRHVLVVHAVDGLDEISIANDTHIAELKAGKIKHYTINPGDFGIQTQSIDDLAVANVNESLSMMRSALDNTEGPARDIVCLNAGAAIYAAGIADSIQEGVDKAASLIESGAARQKLEQLIAHSQSFEIHR